MIVRGLWSRLVLLLLASAFVVSAAAGADQVAKARQQWMTGFVKLEEGGKAEEGGNVSLALELYREALDTFNDVRRRFPSWNPSLLSYRITYCEDRIRRLEGEIKTSSGSMTQPELASVVQGQVEKISSLTSENSELRQKLALTSEALERARREAARIVGTGEDIRQLMAEKKELETKGQLQAAQIEQLAAELKTLRDSSGLREAARKLGDELAQTREREVQLEKAFDTYRRAYENVKARLKEASLERETAQREREAATARLQEAQVAMEGLRQEMGTVRQALDAAGARQLGTQQTLQAREDELTSAREKARMLEQEAAGLRSFRDRTVGLSAEKEKLAVQVQQLTQERGRLADTLQQAEQARDTLRNEVETLKTQLQETEQTWAGKLAAATAARERTENELAAVRAASTGENATEEAAARLEGLQQELQAAGRRNGVLTAELVALQAKHTALAGTLGQLQARAGAAEELEKKLREARVEIERQQQRTAAAENAGVDTAALGTMLKMKEDALALEQQRVTELRADLEKARNELHGTRQTAAARNADTERLQRQVAVLEERNLAVSRQLREASFSRQKWDVLEAGLRGQVQEAQDMVKALEQERARLEGQLQEHTRLLRTQEAGIATLETAQRSLQSEKAEVARRVEELEETIRLMRAKTEVVDGLAASLGDADKALKQREREMETAQQRRDAAIAQARDLQAQLEARQREIANYRKLLEGSDAPRASGQGDLLRQVRDLSLQLEKESQRRRALEAALADQAVRDKAPVAANAAIPVPDVSLGDERERRLREQTMLIRGYLRQGLAAEKNGDIEASRWNYLRVLEHEPDNEVAAQRLGLIAAEQGDDEQAVQYLKRAFRLDPDDLNTLLPLGFALVRRSESDLAISMLSRAVALEPDNPNAHRCLGIACSTLGWYDAAEVQFRRTHGLNSEDAENAFNLAVLLATRKPPRLDEAREWYQRARRLGVAPDPGLDAAFGVGQ